MATAKNPTARKPRNVGPAHGTARLILEINGVPYGFISPPPSGGGGEDGGGANTFSRSSGSWNASATRVM